MKGADQETLLVPRRFLGFLAVVAAPGVLGIFGGQRNGGARAESKERPKRKGAFLPSP